MPLGLESQTPQRHARGHEPQATCFITVVSPASIAVTSVKTDDRIIDS